MIGKAATGALIAITLTIVLIAAGTSAILTQLLGGSGGSSPSPTALSDIPPDYLLLYQAAAQTCPGLDWTILAGIGKVETDHGRSTLPGARSGANSAGAMGPMQMLGPTFAEYDEPVPSGGADPPSPYDPIDAIYAAARMLCANGARDGADLHRAIYAYNPTETYVTDVLNHAHTYATINLGDGAPPAGGGWTPAIGQTIANRALTWLGWPYSYAAGNANGPTLGQAIDYDSRNDNHITGFDCSGLVLYALAPWKTTTHLASAQYSQAGHQHPDVGDLQPGDLVFWSDDGTINGISHDAIYIGNGNVVQAPHSGAYIEITPLNAVESGYLGATRPLT